ncbi:unnamed protein product [Polarella glacialis]|uniref:RRM domain-containing protein n=1 Tax=Polarella glacialis TaxID=89957 RepID=A0A813DG40_POLGL|nr:unnamed protein product [Polarella glacialis]CAE8720398.1 unnamed protein product [Polarella glacialis]
MVVQRLRSTAQASAEGLRLFIAGVPWQVSEDTLRKDFEECGVIEDLFMLKDADGNSKGRAFITFQEQDAAQAALKFDNTPYGGRTIFVKVAEEKRQVEGKPAKQNPGKEEEGQAEPASKKRAAAPVDEEPSFEKPEGCVSLCLKNLGNASQEEVRTFLKDSNVQSVRMVMDRVTGESRGIAFVDFPSTEDVDTAWALNGQELPSNGYTVEMRYEKVKERPRPDGCLTVAVKKLTPEATEAVVRKLFKGLNSIKEVRVICDKWTTTCNGLAFVEFTEAADVDAAVKRDGMSVLGQTVFVCFETKKKKERGDVPTKEKTKKPKPADAAAAVKVDKLPPSAKKEGSEPAAKKKKKKVKNIAGEDAPEKVAKQEQQNDPELKEAKKDRKKEARKLRKKRKPETNGEAVEDDEDEPEEAVGVSGKAGTDEGPGDSDAPAKAGKAPRKKSTRKALRAAA